MLTAMQPRSGTKLLAMSNAQVHPANSTRYRKKSPKVPQQ